MEIVAGFAATAPKSGVPWASIADHTTVSVPKRIRVSTSKEAFEFATAKLPESQEAPRQAPAENRPLLTLRVLFVKSSLSYDHTHLHYHIFVYGHELQTVIHALARPTIARSTDCSTSPRPSSPCQASPSVEIEGLQSQDVKASDSMPHDEPQPL